LTAFLIHLAVSYQRRDAAPDQDGGPISKSRAALISATVANEVVFPLLDQGKWENLGVLFCRELIENMNKSFGKEYSGYGVRVTKWE
jgi:hypothetical protein